MFVRQAKEVWDSIEAQEGKGEGEGGERVKRVKRVVFSDGLDVERAIALQRGCDELGIQGASGVARSFSDKARAWYRLLCLDAKIKKIDGR